MKKKSLGFRWFIAVIPAVIAVLMYLLLPKFPKFTEYVITRGVFRLIAFPLQWIMSVIPFSVTELVVVLAVPAVLSLAVVWIIKLIGRKDRRSVFEKGCRFCAWCVSLVLLVFMIMDGANFSRIPLGTLMELENRKYTAQELYKVTCDLALKASAAREALDEDENGCAVLSVSRSELLKLTDESYDEIRKEYPFLKSGVWRIKSVGLSHLWSYTGYTGVYCPWLSEASINTDVPDYDMASTAAHELAHTMGFAKENECNFLSFLACSNTSQPDYRYSGYKDAFIYCANALYRADKELWRSAYQSCSAGMLRDIKQSSEYWKGFEGEIEEAAQEFNDAFIKTNGVESGTLSYNEMVGLVLRYYDTMGLLEE